MQVEYIGWERFVIIFLLGACLGSMEDGISPPAGGISTM